MTTNIPQNDQKLQERILEKQLPLIRALLDEYPERRFQEEIWKLRGVDARSWLGINWYHEFKEKVPHFISVENRHLIHSPLSPNDIYVGRGRNSILGNPWTHLSDTVTLAKYKCNTREEAIQNYDRFLRQKLQEPNSNQYKRVLNDIYRMAIQPSGVRLLCWCAPQPCHAYVIKKILHEKMIERARSLDFN